MSLAQKIRDGAMPWGGMIGAALGGAVAHQTGSDSVFTDCAAASPSTVLVAGLLGLIIAAAGALASWRVHEREREAQARRFIATVSLMLAALVAFAILLPMIAALMIPPCHA